MLIQVAKHLGATHIVANGRHASRLAKLGTDTHVYLAAATADVDLAVANADVKVELDHLWGEGVRQAMETIVPACADDSQSLSCAQIGSVGGRECVILSSALRATHLQVVSIGCNRLVLVP